MEFGKKVLMNLQQKFDEDRGKKLMKFLIKNRGGFNKFSKHHLSTFLTKI